MVYQAVNIILSHPTTAVSSGVQDPPIIVTQPVYSLYYYVLRQLREFHFQKLVAA